MSKRVYKTLGSEGSCSDGEKIVNWHFGLKFIRT